MSDTTIKVENLSKKYLISHQAPERYTALRDVIASKAKRITQNLLSLSSKNQFKQSSQENFWALKDVSFGVKQGEAIGIIGRNGAGKTTLLKILSRITEPTTGRFQIKGRVASLLEVGTGFHPELTGRENIFLNGAILGMGKAEIKRKFDEIVAFAEIEYFLDTPVKRYSSGMYVRLAFAVAAHLEPEILLVDEVLAVGDAEFQKKAIGKMQNVSNNEGRTVIFVSHNMAAIKSLTDRCILINSGCLQLIGESDEVIQIYLKDGGKISNTKANNLKCDLYGFHIRKFAFDTKALKKGFNKPLTFILELDLEKCFCNINFGFGIANSTGARILTFERNIPNLQKGFLKLKFILNDHNLPPGDYSISIGIKSKSSLIHYTPNLITVNLSDDGIDIPYLIQERDRLGVYLQPECIIQNQRIGY